MPPIILNGGGGGVRRGSSYSSPGAGSGIGKAGCITAVVIAVIVLFVVGSVLFGGPSQPTDSGAASLSAGGVRESTTAREKLPGSGYKDEVFDQLGWINTSTVASGIRPFYEKTGVQPAIYLENRPDLMGDEAAQQAEAERVFNELGLGNDAFLFCYFDDDGNDGEWMTWTGSEAVTVMDDEATQIFSDYLTQNWFSDKTEDNVFLDTFNSTADRIMSRTTNANDVMIYVWIAVAVVGAGLAIYFIAKQRRKHEAERAAETARILSTPMEDLSGDPELLKKYQDDNKK